MSSSESSSPHSSNTVGEIRPPNDPPTLEEAEKIGDTGGRVIHGSTGGQTGIAYPPSDTPSGGSSPKP